MPKSDTHSSDGHVGKRSTSDDRRPSDPPRHHNHQHRHGRSGSINHGAKRGRKGGGWKVDINSVNAVGGNWRDPLNLEPVTQGQQEELSAGTSKSPTEADKTSPDGMDSLLPVRKHVNKRDPLGIETAIVKSSQRGSIELPSPTKRRRKHKRLHSPAVSVAPKHLASIAPADPHARPTTSTRDAHQQTEPVSILDRYVPNRGHHRRQLGKIAANKEKKTVDDTTAVATTIAFVAPSTPAATSTTAAVGTSTTVVVPATSKTSAATTVAAVERKAKYGAGNKARFQYGNYDRYYGRRLVSQEDERISAIESSWLAGADVLDIGCNDGTLSVTLAEQFATKSYFAIDIDTKLVQRARVNRTKRYDKIQRDTTIDEATKSAKLASLKATTFQQCNYVLSDDDQLAMVRQEFDTVIAFSVTKWIHVNWGDTGLKRFFKRIYASLRPGGRLLLESQPLNSYERRKCCVTETMKAHFEAIAFKPSEFADYLLSGDCGFVSCHTMRSSVKVSDGFRQRSMRVFVKGMCDNTEETTEPVEDTGSEMTTEQSAAGPTEAAAAASSADEVSTTNQSAVPESPTAVEEGQQGSASTTDSSPTADDGEPPSKRCKPDDD